MRDTEIFQVIQDLQAGWSEELSAEDASTLAQWLADTPRDDPAAVRRTVGRVLDLVSYYPRVKAQLVEEMKVRGLVEGMMGGFLPTPGRPRPIPATITMVCPEEDCTYRRPLQFRGQRLFCPHHNVALEPEGSRPREE